MGSHQITREGEMYYCLLLIPLISPAFGRPGSTQEYVEELRRILSEDRALILNTEEKQAKYEEDKAYTETMRKTCKWTAVLTLGLCSLIHHFVNEVPLEKARVELERLRALEGTALEKHAERLRALEGYVEKNAGHSNRKKCRK